MEEIVIQIQNNKMIIAFLFAIIIDIFMGLLRACKEKKLNSNIGIDGGIRKVAMIGTVAFLFFVDKFIQINFLFMIPENWLNCIGVNSIGLCEFFCILYILFECLSILKNMAIIGLPVPKLQEFLESKLKYFTDELSTKNTENKG